MNLVALHAKAMNYAFNVFRREKTQPLIIMGLAPDLKLHVFGPSAQYFHKREFYWSILQAYFAINKIDAYAYASEAWIVARPWASEAEILKIIPAEQPDRIEVIMTGALNHTESLLTCHRIVRLKGEPAKLGAEFNPHGARSSPGESSRTKLDGLLVPPEYVQEEFAPIADLMVKAVLKAGYFSYHEILTPVEYEGSTN